MSTRDRPQYPWRFMGEGRYEYSNEISHAGARLRVDAPHPSSVIGFWSWSLRVDGEPVGGGGCSTQLAAQRAAETAYQRHAAARAAENRTRDRRVRLTEGECRMLKACAAIAQDGTFEWARVQTRLYDVRQPAALHYAQVTRWARSLAQKGYLESGEVGDEFGTLTSEGISTGEAL